MILQLKISCAIIFIGIYALSCSSEAESEKMINDSVNSNPTQKFENFFEKFAKSASFQMEHVKFPLPVYYIDEEGEKHLDRSITKSEWQHLKFQDKKTDIDGYRWVMEALSASEVLSIMRGIDNGIHIRYRFLHQNNNWALVEIADGST